MQFKVYCKYLDYANTLDIYIFEEHALQYGVDRRAICTSLNPLTFKKYDDDHQTFTKAEPVISLTGRIVKPFLQAIANELKTIDIVADGEPVIKNELVSTKYHLEDMRKLVFETISKKF